MPRYDFSCSTCGRAFEKDLPLDADRSRVRCPAGHRDVHRVYRAPSVVFKGSGFYITDHRSGPAANNE